MSIQIDFGLLRQIDDPSRRLARAADMLRGQTKGNQLYISDAIVQMDAGGSEVIIALSSSLQRLNRRRGDELTWCLQVLRDEWGVVPVPGDAVRFVEPINRKDLKGHPVGADEFNRAKTDGSYSERFELVTEYEVDKRGCIHVPWDVAVQLLSNYGVHGKTRRGICDKPELSKEPCKHPDGGLKHVWYWRYAEMAPDMYSALPELQKSRAKKEVVE